LTTKTKRNVRGDAYKVVGDATEGRGVILEPWEKNITFEEFADKQEVSHWLNSTPDPVGHYFIEADVIQEGSMSAPEIFGVFIPKGVDKKKVADELRRFWGPATKLMKR
jgi:hypothetical protein